MQAVGGESRRVGEADEYALPHVPRDAFSVALDKCSSSQEQAQRTDAARRTGSGLMDAGGASGDEEGSDDEADANPQMQSDLLADGTDYPLLDITRIKAETPEIEWRHLGVEECTDLPLDLYDEEDRPYAEYLKALKAMSARPDLTAAVL
ncbi:hypothetical protein CYMTET_19649, partial [Cymbomonas tetramitiformis]